MQGGVMNAQVTRHELVLDDNKRTVEFLLEEAGDDMERIAEVKKWGERRTRRIGMLRRFVGLEKNGIFERHDGKMSGIIAEFATTQCLAIATTYGLDGMGYTFNDSESGPLCADLGIDLQAVEPAPADSPTGLFGSPKSESEFLEKIRGKDIYELGRIARLLVIDEEDRMIPLNAE